MIHLETIFITLFFLAFCAYLTAIIYLLARKPSTPKTKKSTHKPKFTFSWPELRLAKLFFFLSTLWFLGWILYNLILWRKPLLEISYQNLLLFTLSFVAYIYLSIGIKPQRTRVQIKPAPTTPNIDPNDPCIRQKEDLHFGFLHKLSEKTPVPMECLPCQVKIECLEGKKSKT